MACLVGWLRMQAGGRLQVDWFCMGMEPLLLPPQPCAGEASAHVENLKRQLKETAKRLRATAQRQRRVRVRESSCGLGPAACKQVLAAYILSDYDVGKAATLAQHLAAAARCGEPLQASERFVEDLFLAAAEEDILSVSFPASQAWQSAVAKAARFLAEEAALTWVGLQNYQHGSAPTAREVFLQVMFHQTGGISDEDAMPRPRSINAWAARWRRRWGVQRRALKFQEDLEPETLLKKARQLTR